MRRQAGALFDHWSIPWNMEVDPEHLVRKVVSKIPSIPAFARAKLLAVLEQFKGVQAKIFALKWTGEEWEVRVNKLCNGQTD